MSRPTAPAERWGLDRRRLYLCTPDRPDLEHFVESCIEGGVDVVQLREKHLTGVALSERAVVLQRVCADYNVPFVLNDDPSMAAALGADGVHIGQDDLEPAAARTAVGKDAIVGLSTHTSDDLDRAVGSAPGVDGRGDTVPVDYISAGPVSPTPTKPGRPGTGIDYVREASRRAPWTVWVTGGVDPTTVGPLLAVGARHFVVVRWLTEATDPKANARALRRVIDETVETNEP